MSQPPARASVLVAGAVVVALVAALVTLRPHAPPDAPRSDLLAPEGAKEVLFGIHHDREGASALEVADRLGRPPAVVGSFARFPFSADVYAALDDDAATATDLGAALLLTLEPHGGLSFSQAELRSLTGWLERWNDEGLPVLVRFGHEMNGSWYPWGQRPSAYVDAFREVAEAVGAAPASDTMWAPNEGTGYPFADRGDAGWTTLDIELLDTDGDGEVTQADDPYAPYWPGAEHVDWVGLSVYHFGDAPPWGENTVPRSGSFLDRVRGTYDGPQGDATAVPDFHETYVLGEDRPFAIAETSALFVLDNADTGAPEEEIKAAWAAQLFDAAVPDQLPGLDLVVWFEHVKPEAAVPGVTSSWAITADDSVLGAFVDQLPPWSVFADGRWDRPDRG
jgi:hypothetical protein